MNVALPYPTQLLVEAHWSSLKAKPLPGVAKIAWQEVDYGQTVHLAGCDFKHRETILASVLWQKKQFEWCNVLGFLTEFPVCVTIILLIIIYLIMHLIEVDVNFKH